jgi:hypothetical protein
MSPRSHISVFGVYDGLEVIKHPGRVYLNYSLHSLYIIPAFLMSKNNTDGSTLIVALSKHENISLAILGFKRTSFW